MYITDNSTANYKKNKSSHLSRVVINEILCDTDSQIKI